MLTALRQPLGIHRSRLLKSYGFRLSLDRADERHGRTHPVPQPVAPYQSHRCGCSKVRDQKSQTAPKYLSNKGLRPHDPAHNSVDSWFEARRDRAARQVCYLRFVCSGSQSRHRESREGQNAQVSANWPFLRILAQSPLSLDTASDWRPPLFASSSLSSNASNPGPGCAAWTGSSGSHCAVFGPAGPVP
jgi:hypothetical protein